MSKGGKGQTPTPPFFACSWIPSLKAVGIGMAHGENPKLLSTTTYSGFRSWWKNKGLRLILRDVNMSQLVLSDLTEEVNTSGDTGKTHKLLPACNTLWNFPFLNPLSRGSWPPRYEHWALSNLYNIIWPNNSQVKKVEKPQLLPTLVFGTSLSSIPPQSKCL